MANTGFLRTTNFGGFKKEDVLAYVDELNTKIYNLEAEVNEKNEALEGKAPVVAANFEGAEQYEELLAEEKAKISELMAAKDTLNLQVSNLENELEEKNSEIQKLNEEKVMLNEKLEEAKSDQPSFAESSFDIGSVFIEAKHSADRIIMEAKNAAKKIEEDSKALSEQIVDDANQKAEEMVVNAKSNSDSMIFDAETKSKQIINDASVKADGILTTTNLKKEKVMSEMDLVSSDIEKLATCLNGIVSDGVLKLTDMKSIVANYQTDDNAAIGELVENEKKNSQVEENGTISQNDVEFPEIEQPENVVNEEVVADSDVDDENSNSLNIDLDLLAGLTAEIEANPDSGSFEEDSADKIYDSWNVDDQDGEKISLID